MVCDSDRSEFKSEGLNITKQTIPDRHEGAARLACHPGQVLTPAEVNDITAYHSAHLSMVAVAECAWLTVTAQILRVKD